MLQNHPQSAVTFVDNHDTQRGQALESTVEEWFKPAAYALILLHEDGLPCIFYGDYYGIKGDSFQSSFQKIIDKLLELRRDFAYGPQQNYLMIPNCIGWTRLGHSPIALLISNKDDTKRECLLVRNGLVLYLLIT